MEGQGDYHVQVSPTGALVYGGSLLRVSFPQSQPLLGDRYVLTLEGQCQRHVCSARITSRYTLEATAPEHNSSERVQLRILENTRGLLAVRHRSVFSYLHDTAYHIALYCLNSVYDPTALENCDHIRTEHFTLADEAYHLDERLSRAFTYLDIPEGWNILGHDSTMTDPPARETLLHFAARCGLQQFALYLLSLPGAERALVLPNCFRELPVHIAQQRRYHSMVQLLSPHGSRRHSIRPQTKPSKVPVKVNRHGEGMASVTTDLRRSSSSLESEIAVLHSVLTRMSSSAASEEIDSWLYRPRAASEGFMPESQDDADDEAFNPPAQLLQPQVNNQEHQRRYRRHSNPKPPSSYHHQRHYRRNHRQEPEQKRAIPPESSQSDTVQFGLADDHDPDDDDEASYEVLEDNLQRLHKIIEGSERLRQVNTHQLMQQDVVKDSLGKLSTSCPSLAEAENSSLDDGHYKSMLNIAPDDNQQRDMSVRHTDMRVRGTDMPVVDADVRICINDVTVDTSEDFPGQEEQDDELCVKKRDKRRSSWCPEECRKAKEKQEKKQMLSITGKSQSLSSLDGNDDSEEEDDTSSMLSISSAGTSPRVPSPHYEGTSKDNHLGHHKTGSDDTRVGLSHKKTTSAKASPESRIRESYSGSDVQFQFPGGSQEDVNGSTERLAQEATENLDSPPDVLPVPSASLTKSVSSPAIPGDGRQVIEPKGSPTVDSGSNSPLMPKSSSTSDVLDQSDLDGSGSESYSKGDQSPTPRRPGSGEYGDSGPGDAEENIPRSKRVKTRRPSFMEKLGYKQRKQIKKSTHQFVSISFSNSTLCDVCAKTLCNKPALQCENCMVNVHENSCQEQIASCAKSKAVKPSDSFKEKVNKHSSSLTEPQVTGKPPIRNQRAMSAPLKQSQQPAVLSPSGSLKTSQTNSKVLRDQSEKSSPEPASIQPEVQPVASSTPTSSHALETSNITETLSVSMESLDEGANELHDFEDDPDLMNKVAEPEAWSVTVDKKTLKKMSNKDIKRQDHIWELIQTERNHCLTLKVMQKIYVQGMMQDLHMGQEMVERVFPQLEELLDIHLSFLQRLLDRQRRRPDRSIECIGDVLVDQFESEMGRRTRNAYGEFCSCHTESVQFYKDLLKDKRFQLFIKKYSRLSIVKHRGVPECILLVTQRMTKYPLLIESILKTTRGENKKERDNLMQAKLLARSILIHIDNCVDAKEKQKRLMDIYTKLDARSSTMLKANKFKKADLLLHNRRLLHEGTVRWISARGKAIEVLAILLSDVIFFLQENNQKYTFVTVDNKPGVLSLSELIVREKSDTRDSTGMFLIRRGQMPDMYQIVCKSMDDRDSWMKRIQTAIKSCPEEDEGVPCDSEEEQRLAAEHFARLRQCVEELYQKDAVIKSCCDEKLAIVLEMFSVRGWTDIASHLKGLPLDESGKESRDPKWILAAVQDEASRLNTLLQGSSSHLSRSVSSVESSTCTPPPLPKRAATIGAFETKLGTVNKKRHGSGPKEGNNNTNGAAANLIVPDQESPAANDSSTSRDRSRRMSASVLQSLRTKNMPDKDEEDKPEKGPAKEEEHKPIMPIQGLGIPSHEMSTCITQIVQFVNLLSDIAMEKETESHSLRTQLLDTQTKLGQFQSDGHDRRHPFQHDKQLEELRNLQESINQERLAWEKEKAQQEQELATSKQEVEAANQALAKQKDEIRHQKEELARQRAALQKQIDFHQLQVAHAQESSVDEPPSPRNPQLDNVLHKRSASDDIQLLQGKPLNGGKSSPGASGLESGETSTDKPVTRQRPTSAGATASITVYRRESAQNRDMTVPIHLLSATNERKISIVSQKESPSPPAASQVLPRKLSSSSSSSVLPAGTNSPAQMLPTKLVSKTTVINRTQSMNITVGGTGSPNHIKTSRSASTLPGHINSQQVHSILPMKLAEGRSKSTSPTKSPPAHKDTKGSPQGQGQGQKDYKEVIFL